MSSTRSMRHALTAWLSAHPLAALAIGLAIIRGAVLVTGLDAVVFEEELYRGTIAKELIDGLKLPLISYRPDPYSLGSLAVAALAVGPFLLLGPTLIALKIVPLAFSLATLAALFVLLDRIGGRRAAVAGGVLFILAPPGPTQLSLFAVGFHTESVVFSLATLLAWYRFLEEPQHGRRLALVGLVTGLGISFTYITALSAAACLASAALARPRPTPRGVRWLLLGLGVGLAPWATVNAASGFEGVRWIADLLAPLLAGLVHAPVATAARLARKTGGVLLIGLPQSYAFSSIGGVPGWFFSYLYGGLVVLLIVRYCVRARVPVNLLPVLAWAALFVPAYVMTGFDVPRYEGVFGVVNFRFFAPLQVALLTLSAVALARSREGPLALVVLAALGLLGQTTLMSAYVPAHLAQYHGYSYIQLGQTWAARLYPRSITFGEAVPIVAAFPEPARRLVYRGLFDITQDRWPDPLGAFARLVEVPPPYREIAVEALAGAIGRRRLVGPARIEALASSLSPREREALYRGYVSGFAITSRQLLAARGQFEGHTPGLADWFHWKLGTLAAEECSAEPRDACAKVMAEIRRLDEVGRDRAFHGIGEVAANNFRGQRVFEEAATAGVAVPGPYRTAFFRGAGWAFREEFSEDSLRAQDWIARLPEEGRPAALEGLRAYEAWSGTPSRP